MANIDIKYDTIPLADAYLAASPTPANAEILLHQVPLVPNGRHEVVSIDIVCLKQLAVDATNDVLVQYITHYDASAAADNATKLLTGVAGAVGDLLTVRLDLKVPDRLYSGRYSLDAGDSLRAVLATTTPDTAGLGYFFVVGYRVRDYNGQ
jgi:hypothetical protein